jgi:hypothetical protein
MKSPLKSGNAAPVGPRRLGRLVLWAMLWIVVFLVSLAFAADIAQWVSHVPPARLAALQARIWHLKYIGVGLQLALIALLGWQWPRIVQWAIGRKVIDPSDRARALAVRGKAVLSLLAFVAVVVIGPGDWARIYRLLFT